VSRPVLEYPDSAQIERLLSQYALVRLEADTGHLAAGDRQALRHLASAARWIDRIYWRQRSETGWEIKQRLASQHGAVPPAFERLVNLGFGPWDAFDNDRPFWGTAVRPPGGGHYPHDLTREEFDRYADAHPRDRDALLSSTTVVHRDGDRLVAIPFVDIFRNELARVADDLDRASLTASHAGFAAFLRARADGLRSGALRSSEELWVDVGDSPIDIAIGPYEVYDDALLGLKASYEATVLVRHPMTDRLTEFESAASELALILPGAIVAPQHRSRVVIGVYDVVFTGGSTNMGAKAVAAMLPNDDQVRQARGSRLLLFRNMIAAKFATILKPLAQRLLRADSLAYIDEDAFVVHTLLHEMSHALVASDDRPDGEPGSANELLRERYSTVEECRADLVGLVFLHHLAERQVLPMRLADAAAVTFVASSLRVLRFGEQNDYGRAATIALSHLMASGALAVDEDGRLAVDAAATLKATRALAERVQAIRTGGRYAEAGTLITELGTLPPGLRALLAKLDDVPVDLELAFDPSLVG
jgi:hypothetical protein